MAAMEGEGSRATTATATTSSVSSAVSVLSELQWDNGFAIPVANAENKALEEEVQMMEKEKGNMQNQLTDCEDRISAMSSHLKNVKHEFNLTQFLFRARQHEIETEQHFKALAEREVGRLKSEIHRLENEMVSLREKKNSQENNVFKVTEKMDALRCQMNCDQHSLETWLEESSKKDSDLLTIQKYAQQDEGKLGVLTLQIEMLTVQCNKKRRILDNELTETLASQIELDKTAEDFRRVHQERQELIKQWENTIHQMKKRDEEMESCALLLARSRRAIRAKQSVLKDKIQFLANESGNNVEYEKRIAITERFATKLRLDYQKEEENRLQFQDELDTLKATLDGTASELEFVRMTITNLKKEAQEKTIRFNVIREQNSSLTNKLKFVTNKALTSEEKACRMEELLKEKEKNVKEREVQAEQLRDTHFKKTKELKGLQDNVKCVTVDIDGRRGQMKNLHSRLTHLFAETLKQQELIYNQDFYIQLVERRLSRMEGELNTDEREVLEAKVAELSKIADEKKHAYNTLQAQQKKLQNDIHFIKLAMKKTGEEMAGLQSRVDELNLFSDKSEKLLKKARADKQDMMIEDNLVKLELKRVRDTLYNKAEKVFSLEKQKQQLKAAMDQRIADIKVHQAMIETQIRVIEEERQTLSFEFHERLSKIEKLQGRYEIITIVMMPPEGEEEKTHTYYVIKAAQEKEDLQREGDTLDAKIQNAEKECVALENTLHVLNNCNSNYRDSFRKVTENTEEHQEKVKLEEEKRAADEKFRYKRRQIKELQEDIQTMQGNLDSLLKDEDLYREKRAEKNVIVSRLSREVDDQQPKLERVRKQVARITREIRAVKKTDSETHEEQDIELRTLKDFSRSIDKMLLDLTVTHPELSTSFQRYFEQASIPFPTHSSSRLSLRSSTQSSSSSSMSPRSSVSASSQPQLKVVSLTLDPKVDRSTILSPHSPKESVSSASSHSKSPT